MAQYSGIFTTTQQMQADAANNWAATPGAPTSVTATAGSGSASVAFTAPSSAGIPAVITGYIVTSSPGGITATGSSSPITVSGLTNGTAYTFTVQAINASGTGPASAASNSVTPSPNYIEDVFSTYIYTGDGSSQTITNGIDLSTKGGLVWGKARSSADNHGLYDTARGVQNRLISNDTSAQSTASGVTAFNANGFSLGSNSDLNGNGKTTVSWTFAKQAKFFDIVTWTGNGASTRSISHSLGSVPGCIIVKQTNDVRGWPVYHRMLNGGVNPQNYFVGLDETTAQDVDTGGQRWGSTAPTSTAFTVGSSSNDSGGTYVAYLFAHDAGGFGAAGTDNVISCGSFSGSATVNLGYEPQWVLTKRSDSTGSWYLIDNMRGFTAPYGASGNNSNYLFANTTAAESAYNLFSTTSTGFSATGATGTYIYIAIRRGPMATPTTGTSVFSPILSGNTTPTALTTNFPVDMQIAKFQNDSGYNGYAADRLRGVVTTPTDAYSPLLAPNSTAAETNTVSGSRAWNNTGFQIPGNWSGSSTIYWNFRRAPGFFDEVCYTGTSPTPQNISHNLGVAPQMMIVKIRSTSGDNWAVYHSALGNEAFLTLNTINAVDYNGDLWDVTTPTATTFRVGQANLANYGGANLVAYLFATVAGVSKVGSYTGNASTQTINCGFGASGARFVLVKSTSAAGSWFVFDTARGMTSSSSPYLRLNLTNAQTTGNNGCYADNTGFTLTSAGSSSCNENGVSYIYLAIA